MADLYDYQRRVDALIRQGKSVILQAPTGAGKTRAALFPFLAGWRSSDAAALPRQCLYVVPMRVLANQFYAEYKQTVQSYTTQFGLSEVGSVSIQTGEQAEDRKFESDLIFTTVDQFLSSFLTIPYSLSNRQANINAGAVIGSYLVFDEFHLFPVDERGSGALATTLRVLHMVKGVTPFVLMTATFSQKMVQHLCQELNAEAVTLTQDEIDAIPSQQGKQRRYVFTRSELQAATIAQDFITHQRHRAIVVCNTVDRATAVAEALQQHFQDTDVHIELIHSRFYPSNRAEKERAIRREFGEDRTQSTWKRAILVATQVIEVGLNITCEALHTEIAPASSVVQRAGRCARFAGESGVVFVYDVPRREDGTRDFAPYLTPPAGKDAATEDEAEGQSQLCERTLAAFERLPTEGAILNYHAELALVNEAHEPFDAALLAALHNNRHALRDTIARTLRTLDRSAASELIRDIDSRTVIIHPNPTEETVPNPYRYEGIGMRRNALLRWFGSVQDEALARSLDWIVKTPVSQEVRDSDNDAPEQRRRIETQWCVLRPTTIPSERRDGANTIASSGLVVINPALVQYDTRLGFQLSAGIPANESPRLPAQKRDDEYGPILRETYAEHIVGLHRVYATRLRERTAAVRWKLENRFGLEAGDIDRAIRLMFAVHDLGKLDQEWQRWAHAWQEKVSQLRGIDRHIKPSYMAAHTDYDDQDKAERDAQHQFKLKRPPHAGESTRAGLQLIDAVAGSCTPLYVGIASAVMCHHSATLRSSHGPFTPNQYAQAAFEEALVAVGFEHDQEMRSHASTIKRSFRAGNTLSEAMIDENQQDHVVFYLLLARILRLADQKSQEH